MKDTFITGLILAGGKSSRMGTDKSLLKLNEKTFIECSIDALKEITSEIIIISNTKQHDVFGYKRIPDTIDNFGPVAGIYTGLSQVTTPYTLVLSCDVPLINKTLLKKLISNIDTTTHCVQFEYKNNLTPLIAVYKTECKSIFKNAITHGIQKLQLVTAQCNPKNILLTDQEAYYIQNVNTIADFNRIKF